MEDALLFDFDSVPDESAVLDLRATQILDRCTDFVELRLLKERFEVIRSSVDPDDNRLGNK